MRTFPLTGPSSYPLKRNTSRRSEDYDLIKMLENISYLIKIWTELFLPPQGVIFSLTTPDSEKQENLSLNIAVATNTRLVHTSSLLRVSRSRYHHLFVQLNFLQLQEGWSEPRHTSCLNISLSLLYRKKIKERFVLNSLPKIFIQVDGI